VICAISQIFLSNLPSKLAETWFKRKESLLISGFSIFASQLGMAVNFLLTPLIVNQSENMLEIKTELEILLISTAGSFYITIECLKRINFNLSQVWNFSKSFRLSQIDPFQTYSKV
jgi:FLVCR family feline leukemia virus subgroup C receptor-related protein